MRDTDTALRGPGQARSLPVMEPGTPHGKEPVAASFGQEITAALNRVRAELGGKNLAGHFDGRDGREVAESTVSRWISEPHRFPALFLPVLVELDGPFRAKVFRLLAARMMTDADLVRSLSPASAAELAQVQERRFLDLAFGPGGKGEGYA